MMERSYFLIERSLPEGEHFIFLVEKATSEVEKGGLEVQSFAYIVNPLSPCGGISGNFEVQDYCLSLMIRLNVYIFRQ